MLVNRINHRASTALVAVILCAVSTAAAANGTESLGAIASETGSGIVAAGVGLEISQVGQTAGFEVPAGSTIRQVSAYWEENAKIDEASVPPTDTIMIGGQSVTGDFIGGFHASGGSRRAQPRRNRTAPQCPLTARSGSTSWAWEC